MTFMQDTTRIVEGQIFSGHVASVTDLDRFMNHAVDQGASDIMLTSGHPALALVRGQPTQLTRFKWQTDQIDRFGQLITNNQSIKTALAGGDDFDHAFDVPDLHNSDEHGVPFRHRFRLNATAILGRGGDSKQLVMRHIPAIPPTLEQIEFPPELYDEFLLEQGMFLIAGETASGKTTTFGGCIRFILENSTIIRGNILTYEKPIEFVFNDIPSATCVVAQSEIGRHVRSFAHGVSNALRRKPALTVIGEMRDAETIHAANALAITGHPVFGTVHARNAAAIIRRMVQTYDFHQQAQAFAEIAENVRLLMSQTLAPVFDASGLIVARRVIRDWCVIDPDRSDAIIDAGPAKGTMLIRDWMEAGDRGRSMKNSIMLELATGRISEETAGRLLKRYGYSTKGLI